MVLAVLLLVSLVLPVLLGTALLLLLLLGVVLLLVRGRRQYRRQQQELALVEAAGQQRALAAALAAQEEERQRIAAELHDGVGTILALARLQLYAAAAPPPEVGTLLDQSISEVRRISRNLQPATLQQLGLMAALRALAQAVPAGGGPAVRVEELPPLPGRLVPTHELMVYRIAQELLANGLRHAQARHIVLQVTPLPGHLRLSYSDDGTGFELSLFDEPTVPATHPAGMGLTNLRSRVAVLGGQLRYDSAPSRGTRVVAELPVAYRAKPAPGPTG